MREYDIVIIGGGPTSLAAAAAARDSGIENILILGRDKELGGILNRCIRNRSGLHTFKEELTGPEYAARFEEQVYERNIEYKLNTMVMDVSHDRVVATVNGEEGLFEIQTRTVILAMGCRERSKGTLSVPGYRPAGIYCADTTQHPVDIKGSMPGQKVVILGFGDIGLIMVRRVTLEGAGVKVMTGLTPYSGGLKCSVIQCLDDYGIPLKLSHTVANIRREERLEGITLAAVDGKDKPIPGTEEDYTCDTLLLSVGLVPENELSNGMGMEMSRVASGLAVNKSLETSIEGVFACGNVLHVHGLMDFVSEKVAMAGKSTAGYMKDDRRSGAGQGIELSAVDKVRYTMPCTIYPDRMEDTQVVHFRVGNVYKNCYVGIYFDGEQIMHRKRPVIALGETEEIKLQKERLMLHLGLKKITVKVEGA